MIAIAHSHAMLQAMARAAAPVEAAQAAEMLGELIGPARIVMLGEATHGTSEFYEWRRIISEQLIRAHGFNFIAVEGDWPDCRRVHEHITTGAGSPREALASYRRFPTWMWGNEEALELVEWLRGFNEGASSGSRGHQAVGFHGLDVYSMHDSMRLVVEYLRRIDPPAANMARKAYECFEPFGEDPHQYAYATRFVPSGCEAEVVAALSHLERFQSVYSRISSDHVDPTEAYFDAAMNARVIRNAEAYYRTILVGDAESWNVRDRHMMETLSLLLEHYGEKSKAIVWAHNTHVGDYRATDMARAGYVNIGGLAREQLGQDMVRLVGFGTHRGTVLAAPGWDEPGEFMTIPPAMESSLEDLMHRLDRPQLVLPLRSMPTSALADLNHTVGHRAIGVVYHPDSERPGQYVPTRLADRYDAFIFIDETSAVHPLDIPADLSEEPEAWPSGL